MGARLEVEVEMESWLVGEKPDSILSDWEMCFSGSGASFVL
jgi:hypothetical protein